MNPNENPTCLCPYCSVRFTVDQNGGDLQHCPTCGALLYTRIKCDNCRWYRELSGHGDGYCAFIPEETSSSSYCAAWEMKEVI